MQAVRRPLAVPEAETTSAESFRAAPAPWHMPQPSQSLPQPTNPLQSVELAAPADDGDTINSPRDGEQKQSTRSGNTLGQGAGGAAGGSQRRGGHVLSSDGSLGSFMRTEAIAAADAAATPRAGSSGAVRGCTGAEAPSAESAAAGADRAPLSAAAALVFRHSSGAASDSVNAKKQVANHARPEESLMPGEDGSSVSGLPEASPTSQSLLPAGTAEEQLSGSSTRHERQLVDGHESAQPEASETTVPIRSRMLQAQTPLPQPPPQMTERHDVHPTGRACEPPATSETSATDPEAEQMPHQGAGEQHVGHHASSDKRQRLNMFVMPCRHHSTSGRCPRSRPARTCCGTVPTRGCDCAASKRCAGLASLPGRGTGEGRQETRSSTLSSKQA